MPVTMPAAGRVVAVHAVGGERRELEKRRNRDRQPVDPLARGQLAALAMLGGRLRAAAGVRDREPLAQSGDQAFHARGVALEGFAMPFETSLQ